MEAGGAGLRLSRLARAIYESRPDLQKWFPNPCGRDAVRFLTWLLTYGKMQYRLDQFFLAPLRQQWHAVLAANSFPAAVWHRAVYCAMAASVPLHRVMGRRLEIVRFG